MGARIRQPGWLLAALLALAMLGYASVRSIVMQAAMAAPASASAMPMCDGGMASMAAGHAPFGKTAPAKSCPYCASAAHAPLVAQSPPILSSCRAVFVAFSMGEAKGARGPPAFRPRARGPPVLPA